MQTKSSPVKSKINGKTGVVVGTATYPEYDSVAEAMSSIPESVLLSVINVQVKTNAMNKIRQEAVGGPSKKELQAKAMQHLAVHDQAKLIEVASKGDEALAALIEETVQMLAQKFEDEKIARLQASGAQVATDAASSDDDDDVDND